MRITKVETIRCDEFFHVLWVRVHTDSGLVGLEHLRPEGLPPIDVEDLRRRWPVAR